MLRSAAVTAVAVVLLTASAAVADDIVEIDERLIGAGLAEAYTQSQPAESGSRVVVDFVSDSTTREQYEQEAALAAELVWEHLEEQVGAVDVALSSGVPWLGDELPPAVSFTRADLVAEHGERPGELDQASGGEALAFGDEALFDVFGLLFVLFVLVVLLVVAALAVAVLVLARRGSARSSWEPAPAWGGSGFGPAGPWPAQAPPAQAPPAPAPPAPAPPEQAPPAPGTNGAAGIWQPPNG